MKLARSTYCGQVHSCNCVQVVAVLVRASDRHSKAYPSFETRGEGKDNEIVESVVRICYTRCLPWPGCFEVVTKRPRHSGCAVGFTDLVFGRQLSRGS